MTTSPAQPTHRPRETLLAVLAIATGVALAYAGTWSVPFLFDDNSSIRDNPTIRSLATAWRPPATGGLTVSGRPFLNFTLAINQAVSGHAVWSYHLLNLLIHAAAGCVLFAVVRRTLLIVGRDRLIPPSHCAPVSNRHAERSEGSMGMSASCWILRSAQNEMLGIT